MTMSRDQKLQLVFATLIFAAGGVTEAFTGIGAYIGKSAVIEPKGPPLVEAHRVRALVTRGGGPAAAVLEISLNRLGRIALSFDGGLEWTDNEAVADKFQTLILEPSLREAGLQESKPAWLRDLMVRIWNVEETEYGEHHLFVE